MEEMSELRSAFRRVRRCFSNDDKCALSPRRRAIGASSFGVRQGSDKPMGGCLHVGDT